MTFTRPANHRQLTFTEIAQSAKIPVNEVSWMTREFNQPVNKSLWLGLAWRTFIISVFISNVLFESVSCWPEVHFFTFDPCFMCLCPAGGASGDEGAVCGPDQRKHWWGGPEGADDLGAAQSAGPAAGESSFCSVCWSSMPLSVKTRSSFK